MGSDSSDDILDLWWMLFKCMCFFWGGGGKVDGVKLISVVEVLIGFCARGYRKVSLWSYLPSLSSWLTFIQGRTTERQSDHLCPVRPGCSRRLLLSLRLQVADIPEAEPDSNPPMAGPDHALLQRFRAQQLCL